MCNVQELHLFGGNTHTQIFIYNLGHFTSVCLSSQASSHPPSFSSSPTDCLLVSYHLFFTVLFNLFLLCFSYKRNPVTFNFLCLTYFPYYHGLNIFPFSCKWHDFIPFCIVNNVPLCMYAFYLSIHLLMIIWVISRA